MNFKKIFIAFVIIALIVAAIAIVISMKQNDDTSKLDTVVGNVNKLSDAKEYVAELAQVSDDDEFSTALMEKATVKITEIDKEKQIAKVEIAVPDVEKIMKAVLPENTDGDFDALLDKYLSDITSEITATGSEDMITKVGKCPIVSTEKGEAISIASMELISLSDIISELIDELLTKEDTSK